MCSTLGNLTYFPEVKICPSQTLIKTLYSLHNNHSFFEGMTNCSDISSKKTRFFVLLYFIVINTSYPARLLILYRHYFF